MTQRPAHGEAAEPKTDLKQMDKAVSNVWAKVSVLIRTV